MSRSVAKAFESVQDRTGRLQVWMLPVLVGVFGLFALPAGAQSFRVQCPSSTFTHPGTNNSEPVYNGPSYISLKSGVPDPTAGYPAAPTNVNGAIKCQQVGGGDGYASMADGTQTYMFAFGPLSGLIDIANGKPGTEYPSVFNTPVANPATTIVPGYPAPPYSGSGPLAAGVPTGNYNGAIGLVSSNVNYTLTIYDILEGNGTAGTLTAPVSANTVSVILNADSPFKVGDQIVIGQGSTGATDLNGYVGTHTVTAVGVGNTIGLPGNFGFQFQLPATVTGLPEVVGSTDGTASSVPVVDGHVDPRQIIDIGAMNGNIPAPLMAIDEDDEYFLTLTNVGMIMRPDLFEQHTVHFHGYANASGFYDGVPDASVAVNIGASFTYYYLAPDAGTYFWHCHISPPEHLQMGMVGQLYVRPRQNRVPATSTLYAGLQAQQLDLRTACNSSDVLCSNPLPAVVTTATGKYGSTVSTSTTATSGYAYNDGDGSTYYDVEVPLQMHGFDPNFHFVGMTFNNEGFADMKDKYFLLNGRSYPDTVTTGALATPSSDGVTHFAQPISALVNIPAGQRALLRISDLSVSEYHTLASLGVRMQVVGWNARLLRDQDGNNMAYGTNSITLAGGESADVILDTCAVRSNPADPSSACTTPIATGTYYLYTSNLDHLSNDAENFGGQMTEVHVN